VDKTEVSYGAQIISYRTYFKTLRYMFSFKMHYVAVL